MQENNEVQRVDSNIKDIVVPLLEESKRLIGENKGKFFKISLSINSSDRSEKLGEFENLKVAQKVSQALIARLVKWMLLKENLELFKIFENCTGGKGGGSDLPRKINIFLTFKNQGSETNSIKPSKMVSFDKFENDARNACLEIRKHYEKVKKDNPNKDVHFTYGITSQDVENRTMSYLRRERFLRDSYIEIHNYDSFQDMRIHELLVIDMIKTDSDYSQLRFYLNNQDGGGAIAAVKKECLNEPGKSYVIFSDRYMNSDGTELPSYLQ